MAGIGARSKRTSMFWIGDGNQSWHASILCGGHHRDGHIGNARKVIARRQCQADHMGGA
jgi:hypothetical protein